MTSEDKTKSKDPLNDGEEIKVNDNTKTMTSDIQ